MGDFSSLAHALFPSAVMHAFEPQPACFERLDELVLTTKISVHKTALGAKPGTVTLAVAQNDEVTTGAHIVGEDYQPEQELEIPLVRLDDMLAYPDTAANALLKLDLQGYELEALKGATKFLERTDVILCEASFFAQAYEPSLYDLITFLHDHEFELQDVAALTERARDGRAHQADLVFIRKTSDLSLDNAWS